MQNTDEVSPESPNKDKKEKKKGKSRKIIDLLPTAYMDVVPSTTYKKKTKSAKIIESFVPETITTNIKPLNVILQLKCTIREIDNYIQKSNWKYQNLTYNPSIPTDIEAYEDNILKKSFGDYNYDTSEVVPTDSVSALEVSVTSDNKRVLCSSCSSVRNEKNQNNMHSNITRGIIVGLIKCVRMYR